MYQHYIVCLGKIQKNDNFLVGLEKAQELLKNQ